MTFRNLSYKGFSGINDPCNAGGPTYKTSWEFFQMWIEPSIFSQKKNTLGAWWSMQLPCCRKVGLNPPSHLNCPNGGCLKGWRAWFQSQTFTKKVLPSWEDTSVTERTELAIRKAWFSVSVLTLATWIFSPASQLILYKGRSLMFSQSPDFLWTPFATKYTHMHTHHLLTENKI